MNIFSVYALMWVSAVVIALLPWAVRKLRGSPPEPRMSEANFLVKMRLHNTMVDSQYTFPFWLIAAIVYLVFGSQDGGWPLFFGGFFLGAALSQMGQYGTSRQLVNLLKKEEERAA